jgi:hypothetical protein
MGSITLILLAIWFIVWGVRKFVPLGPVVEQLLGIGAIIIGILLLIGR